MARLTCIPTVPGDVLVLVTTLSFSTYAVANVMRPGQQDFSTDGAVTQENSLASAIKLARVLVVSGRRIYLSNMDTGQWKIVSVEEAPQDFHESSISSSIRA